MIIIKMKPIKMDKVPERENGKLFKHVKFCCWFSRINEFIWLATSSSVYNLWPKITVCVCVFFLARCYSERKNHSIFCYLLFSGFTGSYCFSSGPFTLPPLFPRLNIFTIWHYAFALPEILKYDDIVDLTK